MLAAFLDDIRDHDIIAPRLMAERLRLPMSQLAKLARVNRNTMTAKPASPAIQAKLGEIARIIARAAELAEDEGRAIIWFKYQPLPGWGNKTPEDVVEEGYPDAVMDALERMAAGVYS
ncbi:antitoxin Xre/MbcA/ParS toxin-binding domain-containing protein [Sphingomonas immobilis]|uniref:DUF2384 domain-containing protein n=1 Tax=Sphingomonas immobilis TaxID=3063997 RepID=A0ABT8ZUN5_9SPHN|nr:antitoxin Xre/MbcA/ParS toxin-binding domain-containing protein [Sphingomonas sp. CA1-15]MDO7841286.1 DUF2384 domain-containing protein [Sphingomonas sp. CA1-15]